MQPIDLRAILRRTVADRFGDLVTRRTGAAVRTGIEEVLAAIDRAHPAVIDFSAVRLLDLSCADEIVAKLLLQHGTSRFVIRGLSAGQREALEPVLAHHGLAVVVEVAAGQLDLLGITGDATRAELETLRAYFSRPHPA